MQFNSYIFILFFLPLTLIGYFGLHRLGMEKPAKIYLLVMSLWFYDYFNVLYLIAISLSIVANYCFAKGIKDSTGKTRKTVLTMGILFNVGMIFYFKYKNFFITNINAAFGTDFNMRNVFLPIGISFFTFQQIAFLVDVYKGNTSGDDFVDYALFVSFFPQLVQGPIVLHSQIIPQFNDSKNYRVNYDNLSRGLMMFTRGLAKKVLIADMFAGAVDYGFTRAGIIAVGEGALTPPEILIVMLAYTFQIYFDFSGYSDMAIGVSYMFNIELPMNFNSPYKALSITDFWKRWHMSLTNFLTRYIYIPLGGNRKGTARTYLNIMTVFLISGIWHGANWTFILWGVIHGFFQCINRAGKGLYESIVSGAKKLPVAPVFTGIIKAVSWLVTFIIVNVAWLLFRSDSITQFIQLMKRLTVYNYDIRTELLESFRIPKIRYLFAAVGADPSDMFTLGFCTVAVMAASLVMVLFFPNTGECRYRKNISNVIVTSVIFVICVVSLSRVSTFLYSNF